MSHSIKRRQFLTQAAVGSAVVTFGANVPSVLCNAAENAKSDQRVLVVIEMAGGNDGLNCVVPHSHSVYKQSRDALRISKADTLTIDDELGLHPSLRGFADLLENNQLAVVQGVGYPNPNRSHFESMDNLALVFSKRPATKRRMGGAIFGCRRFKTGSRSACIALRP